jgi:transcriptional regulator
MYIPRHFAEERPEVLHRLIEAYPFGTLVTLTADGLDANHLPFELDPEPEPLGTLRGHVARGNPVWRSVARDAEVLVVFQGPEAYVSPALYPSKREHGRVVPTWNYAVVHAHGPVRAVEDREWLRGLVERLTSRHERARRDPWKLTDAPADFVEKMLRAIVGLEIPIARLAGKWKLSQNRSPADRLGVIEGLSSEGGELRAAMAELMRETP